MHLREAGRLQEYSAQDTTTGRPTVWLTLPGGEPPNDGQRRAITDLVQDVLLVLPALLPPTVAAARAPTTVLERDEAGAVETTRVDVSGPVIGPSDHGAASADQSPLNAPVVTSSSAPPIRTERPNQPLPQVVPRRGWDLVPDRIRRLWAAFCQARRAHAARAAFRRVGIRAAAPHHRRNRVLVVGALVVIVAIGGALAVPARESWRGVGMPAWPLPVRLPSQPPTPALQYAQISGTGHLGLIVRDQPNGRRVGLLPEGAVVRILSGPRHIADARNPIWWEVMHKDVRGWVSARFLDLSMDS
jgi:hypothetical protein